jgi:hypothetical protein
MLAPILGGFMAGNIFNLAKRAIISMETGDVDNNSSEDDVSGEKQKLNEVDESARQTNRI